MLGMVMLVGGIIIVIALIGFATSILFTSHHRMQSQAEDAALQMSLALNKNDWNGQMNNVVESSRELVYTSREANDEIINEYPNLSALSNSLLQESHDAAKLVDEQRISLAQELGKQIQSMAGKYDAQDRPAQFTLPWMKTEAMRIAAVDLGYVRNVPSSVQVPSAIQTLKDFDLKQKLADPRSNLYFGNINARLPAPDNDLSFVFSSLPAPVEGNVPTARLTTDEVFEKWAPVFAERQSVPFKLKMLPSAVHLTALMGVKSTNGKDQLSDSVRSGISATTNGADLEFP